MPELTLTHLALLAAALLVGVLLGYIVRGSRTTAEKKAINAGWQAQLDHQQSEHERLAAQNKSLMEQISQYQASNKDSKLRAKELSDSLKEAFERRDELQRQLKDIRGNLEVAIAQRNKLQSDVASKEKHGEVNQQALKERDERIAKLTEDLENWQQRVPPLVERYKQRDLEAQQLEIELQKANAQLADVSESESPEHTRIEPVDSESLPDGLDASNEPHTSTSVHSLSDLDDQIDPPAKEFIAGGEELADDPEEDEWETAAEADDESVNEDANDFGAAIEYLMDTDGSPLDEADDGAEDNSDTNEQEATGDAADDADDHHASGANGVDTGEFPNVLSDDYATGMFEQQDDLKAIKGVGPAIEKILNDLGFVRFQQIAEMSELDIDRVAQQLKGFRSRIYREDWIGQARSLHYDKHDQ